MALSQDIIYFRLAEKFDIRFSIRAEMALLCKRPELYEPDKDQTSCAIVISPTDMSDLSNRESESEGCLYICLGTPTDMRVSPWCSLICFKNEVPIASVINELQEIFSVFNEWEEKLKTTVLNSGSFQDLIDHSEPYFYDAFCIQDQSFHFIGYSKLSVSRGIAAEFVNSNNSSPVEVVNEFMSNPQFLLNTDSRETLFYSFSFGDAVVRNIFQGKTGIGRLIIQIYQIDDKLFWYYGALLDTLSIYVEMLYARYKGFSRNEPIVESLRRFLVDYLDGKKVSLQHLERTLHEIGWLPEDEYRLIQLRPNSNNRIGLNSNVIIAEVAEEWQGCIALQYYDKLLILENTGRSFPSGDLDLFKALEVLLYNNSLTAGISRDFYDLKNIDTAYKQTEVAYLYGVNRASTEYYYFNDTALQYMLEHSIGSFESKNICSEKLLKLQKYDKEKNAEMCKTLLTYFECRFNASATADKLCIHRTSFLNRLDRIKEIAEIDLESADEVLYLSLSLKVLGKV